MQPNTGAQYAVGPSIMVYSGDAQYPFRRAPLPFHLASGTRDADGVIEALMLPSVVRDATTIVTRLTSGAGDGAFGVDSDGLSEGVGAGDIGTDVDLLGGSGVRGASGVVGFGVSTGPVFPPNCEL